MSFQDKVVAFLLLCTLGTFGVFSMLFGVLNFAGGEFFEGFIVFAIGLAALTAAYFVERTRHPESGAS